MKLSGFRSAKLASVALAGVIAMSALVGPALVPAHLGGSVARADVVVNIDVFHRSLSPYGRWVQLPRYGEVWYPVGVHRGWRPYYDDGHWAYSEDDGWIWVSDRQWGWAPFHYGRWAFDDEYGWVWVPGRVWAPAWVTFRRSHDCIGWAPLPPDADWDPRYGFRHPYEIRDERYWAFVRPEGFLAPRFDRYAFDRRDYPRIINSTTNITNIYIVNNTVVNRSIEVNEVERATHRKVERVRVSETDRPDRTEFNGDSVVIYKPAVVEGGQETATVQTNLIKEAPAQDNRKRSGGDGSSAGTAGIDGGKQIPEVGNPDNGQVSIGAAVDGQQNLRKKKAPDNNALPGGGAGTQGGQSPDIPQVLRNSQKQKKQAGGLPAQSGGGQLRAPVDNGGQDQNFVQPQLNATPKKNNIQRYESGNQSRDLGQPQSNGKPKKHSDGQQLENGGQNQNYFGQPQLDAKPKKNNIQRYESGNQNRDFGRPPSNGQPKKHRDGQQLENGGQNQDFVQPQGNTKRNRQQPQFERQQQEQGQPSRKKGSQTCGGANQPPCN